MTRPNIKNIDAVIDAYYGTGFLSNQDIRNIFGVKSSNTISKLKKPVLEKMVENNIPIIVNKCIPTDLAYEVWQIDIDRIITNQRIKKRDFK